MAWSNLMEKNHDFSRALVLKLPSIYPCRNFMSKIQTLGPDAEVSTTPECLQAKMIVHHLFLPEARENRWHLFSKKNQIQVVFIRNPKMVEGSKEE